MARRWNALSSNLRRLVRLVLLFAIARFASGIAVVALFSRDSVAWGFELTAVVAAMAAVYVLVALAVRWWSPPYASGR